MIKTVLIILASFPALTFSAGAELVPSAERYRSDSVHTHAGAFSEIFLSAGSFEGIQPVPDSFITGLAITASANRHLPGTVNNYEGSYSGLKPSVFSLQGYFKYMNTVSFDEVDSPWLVDNLFHNRINFRWYMSDRMTFSAGMRNRLIYGDYLDIIPGYKDMISRDDGYLGFLTNNIWSGPSALLTTTFDRLSLEYHADKLTVTLGRQRVNWGQAFVWNPNDIFNVYSFFDFDYEERPGSDALRVRYFADYASVADLAVKIDSENKITAAGLYRFSRWGYDIQFLAGIMGETDYVAGAGWSGSLLDMGFSGELSYFHPQANSGDSLGVVLVNAGVNYMFSNSLHLNFEAMYNGYFPKIAMDSFADLYFMPLSVKTVSFSKFSWFGQANYPLHPLLNTSLAVMFMPSLGNGYFVMPSAEYSAGDNLDISLLAQRFSGEFGGAEEQLNMVFIRFRLSF